MCRPFWQAASVCNFRIFTVASFGYCEPYLSYFYLNIETPFKTFQHGYPKICGRQFCLVDETCKMECLNLNSVNDDQTAAVLIFVMLFDQTEHLA